jgi:hypothetical protein
MYGNSEGGHTRNIYLRQINNFIAFLGFPPESQFEKVPWSGPSSAYGGLSSVLKFLRLLSRSTLLYNGFTSFILSCQPLGPITQVSTQVSHFLVREIRAAKANY